MTLSLEDQSINLRRRISDLTEQLKSVDERLHKKRIRETGLIGRIATSDRVPGGIVIEDVTFRTWAPNEPQSVEGSRINSSIWTVIHVTSPGYQLHDPNSSSSAA